MPNNNPYMTVGTPSYAAPLMNWQGMANNIGNNLIQRQQPAQQPAQQPGQAAGPMNIRPPAQMQGMPAQGGQPNMPGGWGARLAQMFGLGQMRPGMAGPGGPQQFGGPQLPVPSAQGPTGFY